VTEYYKTTVELDKDAVDQFREVFPHRGMLKYFMNLCLVKFNEIHDHTLDEEVAEVTELASKEMSEFIEEEPHTEDEEDG
jgi:hypothetical protein